MQFWPEETGVRTCERINSADTKGRGGDGGGDPGNMISSVFFCQIQ